VQSSLPRSPNWCYDEFRYFIIVERSRSKLRPRREVAKFVPSPPAIRIMHHCSCKPMSVLRLKNVFILKLYDRRCLRFLMQSNKVGVATLMVQMHSGRWTLIKLRSTVKALRSWSQKNIGSIRIQLAVAKDVILQLDRAQKEEISL
jgi:hypothetical protein